MADDVLRTYLLPCFDLGSAIHGSRVCASWWHALKDLNIREQRMVHVSKRVAWLVKTRVLPALDTWSKDLDHVAQGDAVTQMQFWSSHHGVLSEIRAKVTRPETRLELKAVIHFASDYELKRVLREFHTTAGVTAYLARHVAPLAQQFAQLQLLDDSWPSGKCGAVDARYAQWFISTITPEVSAALRKLIDAQRFGSVLENAGGGGTDAADAPQGSGLAPPLRSGAGPHDPDSMSPLLLSTTTTSRSAGRFANPSSGKGTRAPDGSVSSSSPRPLWCRPGETGVFPRVMVNTELDRGYLRQFNSAAAAEGGRTSAMWTDRFAAQHLLHIAVRLSEAWITTFQERCGASLLLSDIARVHYENDAIDEFGIAVGRAVVCLSDWLEWVVNPLLDRAPTREVKATLAAHVKSLTHQMSVLSDVRSCAKALAALPHRPPPPPNPLSLAGTLIRTVAELEREYGAPNPLLARHKHMFEQLAAKFRRQVSHLATYLSHAQHQAVMRRTSV